jgi:hypothetical protein
MWPDYDIWLRPREPLPDPPFRLAAPAEEGHDPSPGVDGTGWRQAARDSREARAWMRSQVQHRARIADSSWTEGAGRRRG